MNHTQALLFPRTKYSLNTAKRWTKTHGYHPIKYHVTDKYVRARLVPPDSSRYDYRTYDDVNNPGRGDGELEEFSKSSIKRIVATPKGSVVDDPGLIRTAQLSGVRVPRAHKGLNQGGTIGSDLAVGTATVALPLLIYAAKKIYDKVSGKGTGYIGNLRYTSGRSRFRPII